MWTAVLPIFRVWYITPQIQKLREFKLLFLNLEQEQKFLIAWQMSDQNLNNVNKILELQEAHSYIQESTFLTNMQTRMQNMELCMNNHCYYEVANQIQITFQANWTKSQFYTRKIMTHLIQTSPFIVMPILIKIYDNILIEVYDYRLNIHAKKSLELPVQSRNLLKSEIRESSIGKTLQILHSQLENQIIIHLQEKIELIKQNIDLELEKMLKS